MFLHQALCSRRFNEFFVHVIQPPSNINLSHIIFFIAGKLDFHEFHEFIPGKLNFHFLTIFFLPVRISIYLTTPTSV